VPCRAVRARQRVFVAATLVMVAAVIVIPGS
jgi:hypothetical protein